MKIELFFYHKQWSFETAEKARIEAWPYKFPNDDTLTFICSREIEVGYIALLTDQERKDSLIGIFRAEKKKLQADTQVALNKLDDKIQQLLAIENKEKS